MCRNSANLFIALLGLTLSAGGYSASMASYPDNWREWPVMKRGKVFSADTVLPEDASLFDQESVYSYTWMNEGRGSPLTIRVHPDKVEQYKTHGPYTDGITVVAVAEAGDVIWVTEHLAGYPIYGSYNFKGEDISHTHPSLDPDFCHRCHYTYKDVCINGTCYAPKPEEK